MATGIVNSSQEVLSLLRVIIPAYLCAAGSQRVKFKGILYLVLPLVALSCFFAGRTEVAERPPAFALRRVILLAPPCKDATVQKWLAKERDRRQKPPRSPKGVEGRPARIARLLGQQEAADEPEAQATLAQLRTFGEAVFAEAVAARLRERLRTQILPDSVVEAALKTEGWTPETALKPENAPRLCAALESDALLVVSPAEVTVQEKRYRQVTFRIRLQLPALRALSPLSNGEAAANPTSTVAPFAALPVSGEASAGRGLFRPDFALSRRQLVRDAALSAAARAVHALITGEADPLEQEGTRLVITPIPAPAQADVLRFTAQGRVVLPGAVRGLIPDGSPLFSPYLFPMEEKNIITPKRAADALRQMGRTAEQLWTEAGTPDISLLCALGKRLQSDYVLFARIVSVDVLDSPVSRSAPQADRAIEAQAEAMGGLARVRDGAILWQERAQATMREQVKSERQAKKTETALRIAHQAEHFALLQLQRRFRHFRDRFAR